MSGYIQCEVSRSLVIPIYKTPSNVTYATPSEVSGNFDWPPSDGFYPAFGSPSSVAARIMIFASGPVEGKSGGGLVVPRGARARPDIVAKASADPTLATLACRILACRSRLADPGDGARR